VKKIYSAKNPIDAHLLKGVIEAEGIQGVVQGDFLWSTRGEVPITPETCPSVWVTNDEDYEKAMEIVNKFQSQAAIGESEIEEWRCENCNEINEGQFTECWQCGASHNAKDLA
jgi:hypothetical protein